MKVKAIPTCLAVMILGLSLFWVGCSNESSTVSDETGELNLSSEFGGYDATDESAAFGDTEIAGLMREDAPVDDPVFETGELEALDSLRDREVYTLAIRWGMLEFDSTVTQVTDWSGSLQLTHGYLHVHRVLRFERGQDHLIRPRPNRQTLEWVSQTTVSFDGLIVAVIVPPAPDGEDWSDNALNFEAGSYSRSFRIEELADLDEIVDVDDLGNQVAFNATDLDLEPCGSGHLEGRWLLNPSGKNGHFYGRWMTEDGALGGHLRGHFGNRPDGNRVFFGKYVDTSGRFKGLLRGVWGPNGDDPTAGWFRGTWAGHDGRPRGKLGGQWSSTPPTDVADDRPSDSDLLSDRNPRNHPDFGSNGWTPGFFGGRWVKLCPEDVATDGDSD